MCRDKRDGRIHSLAEWTCHGDLLHQYFVSPQDDLQIQRFPSRKLHAHSYGVLQEKNKVKSATERAREGPGMVVNSRDRKGRKSSRPAKAV